MNIISKEDKLFALDLMKKFNIKGLIFKFDPSEKEWPDIWITDLDSAIPTITVTREWQKQDKEERHKRLVHEVLHITGLKHGKKGKLNYSTRPEKDSYSKEVYEQLKNPERLPTIQDMISNYCPIGGGIKEIQDKPVIDRKIESFTDSLTPLKKGKVISTLSKNRLFDGVLKTLKQGIEDKISKGAIVISAKEGRRLITSNGAFLAEKDITKIGMDYAEYIINQSKNPFLADLGTAAILGAGFTGGSILANLAGKKFLNAKNPSSAASVLNWVQTRFKNPEDIESYRSSFQDVFNKTLLKFQQIFPGGVSGRIKTKESIIEKLGRRNKKIEELTDIAGIRVVFLTLDSLYSGLDKIRSKFNVVEEENYINQPRKGYRSYHLIIMVDGKPIEIQLKTLRMSDWSEKAHDSFYKNRSLLVEKYGEKIVDQAENYMSSIADYYSKKDEGQEVKKPRAPRFWDKLRLPLFMLNPNNKYFKGV